MINTKNLLLAAAVAGLVAGTSIAKAEDEHAAEGGAPKAEEGAAPAAKKAHKGKGKAKAKGHAKHEAGKGMNGCESKDGCHAKDKGAEKPAEGETK